MRPQYSSSITPVPHGSQPILAIAALASGAALVVSIFSGASLALTLILLAATSGFLVAFKWSHSEAETRLWIKAQLLTGLVAGIFATAAYDLSRLLLTELGQLNINPFETFNIFGQLIVGESAPRSLTLPVGTAYHFLNGIAFAVSYCFMVGGRNWKYGILWAFALEAAMFTIYPGWLNLEAVMAEFVTVSVLGHVAYGTVLGLISQNFKRRFTDELSLTANNSSPAVVEKGDHS